MQSSRLSLAVALMFWLVLALLPFSRLSAIPMLALSLIGLWVVATRAGQLSADRRIVLLLFIFACYWVPLALAAVDAFNASRSWTVTAAALRFILAGVAVISLVNERDKRVLFALTAGFVAFLCIDALVQAGLGFNLVGMPRSPERLNGIFGTSNIKLGPVLAATSPVMLEFARRRLPAWGFWVAFVLAAAIILLIGTRAAWVMFGVVCLAYLYLTARKSGLGLLKSVAYGAVLIGALGLCFYQFSAEFQSRVERSLAVLNGDAKGLDEALAYRLPIWRTAVKVIQANPINGVGARGFREVYRDYADPEDTWLSRGDGRGASHAHQIILEVLTETGSIGLLGLILAIVVGLLYWRSLSRPRALRSLPYALALMAILFPLNSHLAIYSTFWSVVLWWFVIALFASGSGPAPQRAQLA